MAILMRARALVAIFTWALLCSTLPAGSALAVEEMEEGETRPVQLSVFSQAQLFPERDSIKGMRLSLFYGRNAGVTGFDLGLVSESSEGFTGAALSGGNIVEGDTTGLQLGLINSSQAGKLAGGQVAVVNQADQGSMAQLGIVNRAEDATGLQLSAFNSSERVKGLQLGAVNSSQDAYGLQLGFINHAKKVRGLQIGAINVIEKGGWFWVLPLVNGSF